MNSASPGYNALTRRYKYMARDRRIPPYLPFSSFLTALDQLAQAVPNIIRKDVFPSHSGLLQGQVISALKFFDLIDEHGAPRGNKLERLALEDTDQRRVSLRLLLKTGYAEVIKLDLGKVTPSQLDAAFGAYGVSGDTKKKAKIFFLQAAKFAELNLSPLLVRRGRTPLSSKKRRPTLSLPESDPQSHSVDNHRAGTSKTIQLKSGAILTVTVSGNLLELDASDRDLVYGIMDQIRSHIT
jgi:hypothetical protein